MTYAELLTAMEAWPQKPNVTVYIGGRILRSLAGSADCGYDIDSAAAEVVLDTVPDWLDFNLSLTVYAGYGGFGQLIFDGFIEERDRDHWPYTNRVAGAGWMKLMQREYPNELSYASKTDGYIISDLVVKAGIPRYAILDTAQTLGTVDPVVLGKGQAPILISKRIDEDLGTKTLDQPDGTVRRRYLSPVPADTALVTFTEGVNILQGAKRLAGTRELYNKILVLGSAAVSPQPSAERQSDSPYVRLRDGTQKYVTFRHESNLIETQTLADSVALRRLPELNRVLEEIQIPTWLNPTIYPGFTASLTAEHLGVPTATLYWIRHVRHQWGDSGFLSTVTLEGGKGETGYPSPQPPMSGFAYRITKETYEVSGTPSTMYTVVATAAPVDPDTAVDDLTLAWTNNKNADTGTGDYYSTAFTPAEMAATPKPTISLAVTDPEGNADTATHTMDKDADEILVRELFVAAGEKAEASGDGWETVNSWTPGGGVEVVSTPRIAPEGYSYLGLSDGKLYVSSDYLATAPTLVHDFSSQVNGIWVNEINRDRVAVGLENGEVHLSRDATAGASSTWEKLTTYGSAVKDVVESAFNFGQFWVAVGEDVRVTYDEFASDAVMINWSGGTAQQVELSFFAHYGAATHSDAVKRSDGVPITFPALTPAPASVRIAHHIAENILWAGDDQGRSFMKDSADLDFTQKADVGGGAVNCLVRDGDSALILYAACADGFYKTFDGMVSWVRLSDYSAAGLTGYQCGYGSATLEPIVSVTKVSDSSCYVKTLWDTDHNDDPPSLWYNTDFVRDGTWVAATEQGDSAEIAGAKNIWGSSVQSATEEILVRLEYTLDPGQVTTAQLQCTADNKILSIYSDGVFEGQKLTAVGTVLTIDLDAGMMGPGDHVLAFHVANADS